MAEARALVAADVPNCLALSSAAGWNQTAEDWQLILRLGKGRGLFQGAHLVATAAVLPYGGRFGWICMVLVAPEARRQGHATALMQWAMETLQGGGLVPGLDATPAGRRVYGQLGFRSVYPVRRMQARSVASDSAGPNEFARPASEPDLPAICAYDTEAFGAARQPILAALRARSPRLAYVAGRTGVSGFALGRDGRLATQIGPVVADNDGTARILLSAALSVSKGPVFIDVPERHRAVLSWLESLGFETQREFTRMLLGRDEPLDDPQRIYAIAGPELA